MSSTNVPVTQAPPTPVEPEPSAAEPSPQPGLDEMAAAAVDVARQAAVEVAEPDTVGEHLGVTLDEGGLTMHSFRCTARGYRGWRWAVTLAHVPGSDRVTVCDTVLLPGADSIQAPAWVPWSDRLAPGDLGAGDDLPYRAEDPLLVPGYTVTDEDDADQQLFWELGLGRKRVIGRDGLRAAADRWERGPHGPTSEVAIQASAACVTCAYLVPVSGFLGRHFGVCANEWSPADGAVVTTDFGCGAHSETDLELPVSEPLPAHILDETIIEQVFVDRDEEGSGESSPEVVAEVSPEPVSEVMAEPVSEVVAEPSSEVVAEVVAEPVSEVVAEPVSEVVAEPASEVVAEPVSEVAAEVVAEPVSEVAAEVVAEPVSEVVAEPVSEVVAEVAPEPVSEVVAEAPVEVLSEPSREPSGEPSPEAVESPEP
ncbi:MAG TPA: DUF3027 domain-containing protein [Kineosporiaceae bacterium]|nr:DUF3027 domain-containing protein [Kineosporiaceae bacterium]